jgi:serine protease inhibitor ecotin
LDFARAKNAGLRVVTLFPEADAAMPLAVVSGRKRADRDPLRGSVVAGYIILADRNALKNGGTVDRGEVEARLKKLLTAVP